MSINNSAADRADRDCGWFYYAPPKLTCTEPQKYALPSQIDCLSSVASLHPEDAPRLTLKESDSDYIKLAKMGGRQDLLCFKENSKVKKDPKPYPRVNWFYLEDQRLEDESQEKTLEPYQSGLPDYMVHEHYNPGDDVHMSESSVKKPPWGTENNNHSVTFPPDNKIEEKIKPGYGRRSGRPLNRKSFPVLEKDTSKNCKNHNRVSISTQESKKEKVSMGRLLSNDYGSDIQERLARWEKSKKENPHLLAETAVFREPAISEYNNVYGQTRNAKKNPARRQNYNAEFATKSREEIVETKEPFKLSKFKNISAKIDSNNKKE